MIALRILNEKLPSYFIISLQNFFSFLPFVKKVDPRIKALRLLVNQGNEEACNSYCEEHFNFFNDALNLNITPRKKNALDKPPAPEDVSMEQSPSVLMHQKLKVSSNEPRMSLETLLTLIKSNGSQDEEVKQAIALLENEEKIKLIKDLLAQGDKYQKYAFELIDSYSDNIDLIKKNIFDGLGSNTAIGLFSDYLFFKEKNYVDQLLEKIDDIGNSKDTNGCQCKNTFEYSRFRMFIRPLRDPSNMLDNGALIKEIPAKFNHAIKNNTITTVIKKLITEVQVCLNFLAPIIKETERYEIKRYFFNIKKEQKETEEKLQAYNDFKQDMLSGKIIDVSIQRLKEISLNPDNYKQLIKQCEVLGICVFDNDDLSQVERKNLLALHGISDDVVKRARF